MVILCGMLPGEIHDGGRGGAEGESVVGGGGVTFQGKKLICTCRDPWIHPLRALL